MQSTAGMLGYDMGNGKLRATLAPLQVRLEFRF